MTRQTNTGFLNVPYMAFGGAQGIGTTKSNPSCNGLANTRMRTIPACSRETLLIPKIRQMLHRLHL
jgi:hypothetical protein